MSSHLRFVFLIIASALSGSASAHSFGEIYVLPMPGWMYQFGAAIALVLAFIVTAWLVSGQQHARQDVARISIERWRLPGWLIRVLQLVSLLLFGLAIYAGFVGTQRAEENFNMTYFYIILVLGVAYTVALVGNVYAVLNPWRLICEILRAGLALPLRLIDKQPRALCRYPAWLGYWPALALYMGFIWLELFGQTRPVFLSEMLLAYTGVNVLGSALFGIRTWFTYGEFFSVFMRLLSLMGVVARNQRLGLHVREPMMGCILHHAKHWSVLLFILFMLSSTAFDGLHETRIYRSWLYQDVYQWWYGEAFLFGNEVAVGRYQDLNVLVLFLLPLVYCLLYLVCMVLIKVLAQTSLSLKQLSLAFAYSLIPIALVYHVSHYYTMLVISGPKFIPLLSDPFGMQWDLFGTADWYPIRHIPDAESVWYTQLSLIVIGHVISTYLSHRVALQLFGSRKKAVLSQLPILLLMIAFTWAGLWVLGQPIKL